MVLASQASRQSPRNLMNSSQGRRGPRMRLLVALALLAAAAVIGWMAWSWVKSPRSTLEVREGPVGEQVPENVAPPQMAPAVPADVMPQRAASNSGTGAPQVIGAGPATAPAATQAPPAPASSSTQGSAPVAGESAVASPAGSATLDAAITLSDSNPVRSRMELTRLLESSTLAPADRLRGYDAINRINGVLLFSNRLVNGDPYSMTYKVEQGDSLARIAKSQKLDCDWRLVQRINGMKTPNALHAGQSLKLPKGTFHAEVRKGEYRMNLFVGEGPDRVMVASFPVGLGELNTTPTGAFVVRPKSKLIDPPWRNPRTGEAFAANDPKNPIGERWIGLKGIEPHNQRFEGYGIHGTIDEDSIGQQRSMGCVRMHAHDVELVYEMLTEPSSTIVIAP